MNVFIRSALLLVLLAYLQPFIGIVSSSLQFMIVLFNILIYAISTKSNQNKLKNMDAELENVDKVTH